MTITTASLDRPATYQTLDRKDMSGWLRLFPALFQRGWEDAERVGLPLDYYDVSRILIHGMGGSAIAGQVLCDLTQLDRGCVPTVVHQDYGLPGWVDRRTLYIASSYSGNTDEVLSGAERAHDRGAKLIALTSGGELKRFAAEIGAPVYSMPEGGAPRALFPYSLGTLVRIVESLERTSYGADQIQSVLDDLASLLRRIDTGVPTVENEAKQLASSLVGHTPLILGGHTLSAVARRWKTQFNENAKVLAFAEVLPEAHHNTIVGFDADTHLLDRLFVVLLAAPQAPQYVRTRFEATAEHLTESGVSFSRPTLSNEIPLGLALQTALLGDYVSYYLGLLNGVDPTPITAIDRLKERVGAVSERALAGRLS